MVPIMSKYMKQNLSAALSIAIIALISCSKMSSDAVDLTVDYSWQGYKSCGMGLPQMSINGIPENTKFLHISMYDHKYGFDHGEVTVVFGGFNTIALGSYKEITGPCPPPNGQGRYKITVKALDENDIIVGIGKKEKYFPEKK
jgi:phosphatidylethanolamine-binding protein (PEBP) family uncharacterized protein